MAEKTLDLHLVANLKPKANNHNALSLHIDTKTYPVVEKLLTGVSMHSGLRTSRDCSVMRLPRYWLLTLTLGT